MLTIYPDKKSSSIAIDQRRTTFRSPIDFGDKSKHGTMNSQRKMTPKGQMSGSGSGPAISHLPPHLKGLFEPKPPVEYKAPIVKRKMPPLSGIAMFVDQFENEPPPEREIKETPKQRRERNRIEKMAENDRIMQQEFSKWDPHANSKATEDSYKTLFVSRISFDTSENKLRREFEQYGTIKLCCLVTDLDGKSRGYAFIEYERESDMRTAYKHGDGKKIDGRRVLVDVERGRTVKNWKPRRFGGGLGNSRKEGEGNTTPNGRDSTYGSSRSSTGVSSHTRGEDRDKPRDRDRDQSYRGRGRSRSRSRDRSRRSRSDRDRDGKDRGERGERDRGERDRGERGERDERREHGDRDRSRERRDRIRSDTT